MAAFFMKILFTTHQGDLAGSTMSITYLAKGLAEKGHDVHVACREDTLLWQNLREIPMINCHHVSFRSYLDFSSIKEIANIVSNEKIELINAQGGIDRNLTILAKWIYQLKCKLVFTRRQRPRNEPLVKRWFHTTGTDKIVMVSNGLKDIFVQHGYDPNHLEVIHNGVPIGIIPHLSGEEKNSLKSEWGIKGKVIGCLSRKKIQEEVIMALPLISSDYSVLFVGVEEHEFSETLTKYQPKQNLIFTGIVDHKEALKLLQLMDVNVLASHMDGFGLVLVEAMLSGVPVIGSDFGGIPDVIQHGENGFLFQNGNSELLAKLIKRLLTEEETRQKFIKKGRQIAIEKFTIEQTISKYENLFRKLISFE